MSLCWSQMERKPWQASSVINTVGHRQRSTLAVYLLLSYLDWICTILPRSCTSFGKVTVRYALSHSEWEEIWGVSELKNISNNHNHNHQKVILCNKFVVETTSGFRQGQLNLQPVTPLFPLGRAWLRLTAADTLTLSPEANEASVSLEIHRWSCVTLLVCSDDSDRRTAARELSYTVFTHHGETPRLLSCSYNLALLWLIKRLSQLRMDYEQKPDLLCLTQFFLFFCFFSFFCEKSLLTRYACFTLVYFQEIPVPEHEGTFSAVFVTWPIVHKRHHFQDISTPYHQWKTKTTKASWLWIEDVRSK